MILATLNFKAGSQEHQEHTVELERKSGSRHYIVTLDGNPVWEHQAGLLGFTGRFPLLGCQCGVQTITLGGLFTRHRLSVQCPNGKA